MRITKYHHIANENCGVVVEHRVVREGSLLDLVIFVLLNPHKAIKKKGENNKANTKKRLISDAINFLKIEDYQSRGYCYCD